MVKWVQAQQVTASTAGRLKYWTLPNLMERGFFFAFTTRYGGVSSGPYQELNLSLATGEDPRRVRQNRHILMQCLPSEVANRIQIVRQVHASDVVALDGVTGTETQLDWWCGPQVDGHTTIRDDMVLGLFFADCLPVYVADTRSRAVGLAHGGWRGLTGGIIGNLFSQMNRNWGTQPSDCIVALGPSIERSAYQVDEPVLRAVREWTPRWRRVTYPSDRGRARLDLDEAAADRLQQIGITQESIIIHPHGTYYGEDFYSHRRDGPRTGRAMALISRLP